MPATDLKTDIAENAQGPAKAVIDGQVVEQHSLKDQIEADRYLASKAAAKNPRHGVGFVKMRPPGAV